jgi:putative RecB family exonuclease
MQGGHVTELFSHSRLRCFENCAKQFHFRNVLKLPQESEGIEAFVGKRVHEILERLYVFVGQGMVPSLTKVKSRYEQLWDVEYDPDRVRIVREGVPVSFYRELGIRCLEAYYRRHYPFDGDQTLGIEERVEFDLDPSAPGQYRMQGIIDRIARAPDGVLEIQDSKTGNYVPNPTRLDEEPQLALYQIGLGERYRDETFRLVWHYVAKGVIRQSVRSPEQLQALRASSIAVIDRIREETNYEAKKNPLCDWCEFKNRCPAWNPHAVSPSPRAQAAPQLPSIDPEQLSLL